MFLDGYFSLGEGVWSGWEMNKFLSSKIQEASKQAKKKKNQPQASKKGKTKLSCAFRLRIKNDDLPKSIFLHLFPLLTFLETNTCAFLPNCCYSKTLWIPGPLILHVDHPVGVERKFSFIQGAKGLTKQINIRRSTAAYALSLPNGRSLFLRTWKHCLYSRQVRLFNCFFYLLQ